MNDQNPRGGAMRSGNGLVTNAWIVAKREFRERVRSKLFAASTLLLAGLAITVAMLPIIIRAAGRDGTTTIAVASGETDLTTSSIKILGGFLNPNGQKPPPYTFVQASPTDDLASEVYDGKYAGALIATRSTSGALSFQMLTGESLGSDKITQVQVGVLAIGIFDWINRSPGGLAAGFANPEFIASQIGAGGAGNGPGTVDPGEFAGRRIVGVVSVVLIFITVVIYGMWVAAGVVAEKSSRVMELLISAATPEQLVIGKVAGMGLAGLFQYLFILVPALATLLLQDRISEAVLGAANAVPISLSALTPGLLAAYGAFWVLGFILYALVYAAAGSLVSRAEDLQVLALPLSMLAIAGYGTAVMALGGGIGPLVRLASFVPFWSPFVMLTRLTVGRVEPWEVVLSLGLLIAAIPIVAVIAVRVYSAGVLLYGQRPGARQIVGAILNPPV
ncbi:MAG TPA: ABC transporter permease [Candidatus Limnocylindrales bacterium]|jgi:ABC-2 type transport system permease protein|nr:ABC transporter permease [Candidatus Limnocylindrales bacterium]